MPRHGSRHGRTDAATTSSLTGTLLGILLGLATALLASLAYLFSRAYTLRHGSAMRLMVVSHLLQGLACLPLMVLLWPAGLPAIRVWGPWVVGVALWYLMGHLCLFMALRRATASRLSPLLGVKVAVLAGATAVLLGDAVGPWQWVGVGLSVAAAWVLNRSGGRLPWPVLGLLVLTVTGYCGSDLSIRLMIESMAPVDPVQAGLFGATACYVFSGALALAVLPWSWPRERSAWTAAVPYSLSWLLSMFTLFACFALVGIVLGNILQSTRGLMSIGLGVLIAWRGHHHLEGHTPRGVLIRRTLAAAMMSGAVALYVWGGE